jgi:hypothetical protein
MAELKSAVIGTRKLKHEETERPSGKKDSTNIIPMFDLEEAMKLVVTIHDKALETSSLPQVAKGCGYASPTSTPFYRRLTAARLFTLLGSPQAELTTLALDYLKPDHEDAKRTALTRAIMGIPAYADLVRRHIGKKLNTEIVSHSFSRNFSLTDVCAGVCARAFVSSLKFAGFIALDGTVSLPQDAVVPTLPNPPANSQSREPEEGGNDQECQTQTLYLDSKRKRRITIKAPLTVTKDELERIRAWLGFQLIVEEQSEPMGPAKDFGG